MLFKKMFSTWVFATVLLVLASSHAHAGNLVTNGDFSNYTGGYTGLPSQLDDSVVSGTTQLTGWSVGTGTTHGGLFAFLMDPTTYSHDVRFGGGFTTYSQSASPTGGLYVALDAAPTFQGAGISQTLTGLTAGRYYDVSFYWAAAQQNGFTGPTVEQVQVTFGSGAAQSTRIYHNPSRGFSGWFRTTFKFKADATSTLNFLSLGGPNGLPPFVLLDGVSVDANTVPEPSALALSVVGLLGIGALRLHRRAKNAVI